ncbi:hypothetical protein CSV67_08195 [Sporosarcina sp. P2]|uniref:CDP-glycerol glycerophosphotransferase family protein n=1 Tax=Sporosarcina sp. P2 TaxID=2048251 RepID=UPI000C16469F|nr:CDP-glycerol glycerophosphotransferase family protein [Sporosarcina sp. P2]PID02606.1 hypothetical protein CSV67_08195 [Sporosarcina sp. P2]
MEVLVFGTGNSAQTFIESIESKKISILGFLDNDSTKHFTEFRGAIVYPPEKVNDFKYDYIFIASQFSKEIFEQLIEIGVSFDKIIPCDINNHFKSIKSEYEIVKREIFTHKTENKKFKIGITNYNNSNSNGYALFKNAPEFIKEKYEISLINSENQKDLSNNDVICSSLFEGIYDGNHINIEMWHGFPLKRIGVMDSLNVNSNFLNYVETSTKNTQLVLSYSQLYTTFFNSAFPTNISKYKITGMPRNDLLFEENNLQKLQLVTKNKKLNRFNIVFYLPTWRKGKNKKRVDAQREWNTLFGFENEHSSKVIEMVEKNNLFLIVKLHPYEYKFYKDLELFEHNQIFLLPEDKLLEENVHLYELISASKLLITDYSSIFFDTLLLDMPIIFTPTDLKEYRQNKGFLMEPYNYFTPGKTVLSLAELSKEISRILNGEDQFVKQRQLIRNIVFEQPDNKSSFRAWNAIDKYLDSLTHEGIDNLD